jgi:hypothetical protein
MTSIAPTPRKVVLSVQRHESDECGLRYVYAVLSRRAGGVSVGINVSTTHECNWRCVYCQVPNLGRGASPEVALDVLADELRAVLDAAVAGTLFERSLPDEPVPAVVDVAFSGDGEATTSPNFADAVDAVAGVLREKSLAIPIVLITNGSQVSHGRVRDALGRLAKHGGRVWFKFDRATAAAMSDCNGTPLAPDAHARRLRECAALCPTWVQSCWFALDGAAPSEDEITTWLAMLEGSVKSGVKLEGVQLYSLARPSMQPEAPRLTALDRAWLAALAARVEALGLRAVVA